MRHPGYRFTQNSTTIVEVTKYEILVALKFFFLDFEKHLLYVVNIVFLKMYTKIVIYDQK